MRNYEFNHLDYIDSAINILLSIFIGLVFFSAYKILVEIIPFHDKFNPGANSRLYISIFVVIAAAYYPDIIKRYIVNFSRMNYVKVEKSERFNSLEIIPVEVIDGIDTGIRKRLEDYHIVSVQNLATANPVMLFVETPFVIYELVDWVAQAQLITAIGVNKTTKLWDFGIRTILDLEFHVKNSKTDSLIYQALSGIVLPDSAIVKATNDQS